MAGEFGTVILMPRRCDRSRAKNYRTSGSNRPDHRMRAGREMEKERNAADLTAWGHWQRPRADPRTDKPAPPEQHPGVSQPIGR
jgi:hypothetical protein